MGQFLSSIILFIIPGYIAAVLRCGNGEKKNPLQLAADTLCYAFLILAAVSGILYALFGDGDFLVKYQGCCMFSALREHTASRLFWGCFDGEGDLAPTVEGGSFCLSLPACGPLCLRE